MQLSIFSGLVKRIVFYGCEVYAGQLKAGDDYQDLKPVYSICLLEGRLWQDSIKVHHAFRFADHDSGRFLAETLEIHTLELGCYNLRESDLDTASILDRWLFWLLHAHEYDAKTLTGLFPQPAFQQATDTITRIAEITEDKAMYDTREKAIRDRQWALNASREEGIEKGREEGEIKGEMKGEIKLIHTLQEILGEPISEESSLQGQSLDRLQSITAQLRNKIQGRTS
jgi:predicted transposase/invertase (TIGR01784 family)